MDAKLVDERGRGYGSGMITPTRHVIIPATNNAPPPMKTGRSLVHANTFPDKIVRRHELAAAAVKTGPRTTIIIPRMKISDLNSILALHVISFCGAAHSSNNRLREIVFVV